jgi:hypothetical protein
LNAWIIWRSFAGELSSLAEYCVSKAHLMLRGVPVYFSEAESVEIEIEIEVWALK